LFGQTLIVGMKRPGDSLTSVAPVPEPIEAGLAAVLKVLDKGRRTRPITTEDEAHIGEEIRKYRAEQRRREV